MDTRLVLRNRSFRVWMSVILYVFIFDEKTGFFQMFCEHIDNNSESKTITYFRLEH